MISLFGLAAGTEVIFILKSSLWDCEERDFHGITDELFEKSPVLFNATVLCVFQHNRSITDGNHCCAEAFQCCCVMCCFCLDTYS